MLFGGELERTTSTIGLLSEDLDKVVEEYMEWQNGLFVVSQKFWQAERVSESPKATLETLLPRTVPVHTRCAFIATSSNWTTFFDNGILGTDAASPMPVMARRLGCKTIRVTSVKQTLPLLPKKGDKGTWGAVMLEVYGPDGKTLRSICAANDGGRWVFDQSGEPYPFEDLDAYTRKQVRDRFTREMLVEYLSHFDAYPFDESWYQTDAFVLQKRDRESGQPV